MIPSADWTAELNDLLERLIEGGFTPDDRSRLNALLAQGEEPRRYYRGYMRLHYGLEWRIGEPSLQAKFFVPPARPSLPSFSGIWSGGVNYLNDHPMVLSNIAATVIVGIAILAAALTPKSHYHQLPGMARNAPATRPTSLSGASPAPEPEIVSVAQITGKVDCVWVDESTAPAWHKIKVSDKFELKSGLMEITYYSGAKVILQGPCTYEVDSAAGGYLSLGKLTARIEKKGAGGAGRGTVNLPSPSGRGAGGEGSEANLPSPSGRGAGGEGGAESTTNPALTLALSQRERGPDASPQPLAPSPSSNPEIPKSRNPSSFPAPRPQSTAPLFAIRTPTAIVTDLGTEFGVEVEKAEKGREPTVSVHVLSGAVESRYTSGKLAGRVWRVEQNQAVVMNPNHEPAPLTFDRKTYAEPALIVHAAQNKTMPPPGKVSITDLGPTVDGLKGKLQADDDLQRAFAAGTAAIKLVAGTAFNKPEHVMVSRLCDAQSDSVFNGANDGSDYPDNHVDHTFIAPNDGQMDPAVYDIRFGPKYAGSRDLRKINIFHGPNTTRSPYDFDILYSTTRFPNIFRPLASVKDFVTQNGTLIHIECKPGELTDVSAIRLVIRPILYDEEGWIGNSFAEIDVNFHKSPQDAANTDVKAGVSVKEYENDGTTRKSENKEATNSGTRSGL